ncbi:MAG: GvpL/GvpF family gas vesicle protein [Bacteroidetes bacterium]|nr:GvpL/GvpF family gas vesicle protein [Bacteroidota bacterium]
MEKMIYAIVSVTRDTEKLNAFLSGIKGIAGADLYAVCFNEISAVVSDKERATLIADKSSAIEYAEVIELMAAHFTLLPMRFGSVMESSDLISKMLERNYIEIQNNIQKVENKCEFGLKVFCDAEKLHEELRRKSEETANATPRASLEIRNSVYVDYVNKKLKEHKLEELLLNYVDSVIAGISGYVDRLQAVNKFKKMTTALNIIDAVFLLEKDKKDALIHAVGELQNQHASLSFILTGPWPPYNFVDFIVK